MNTPTYSAPETFDGICGFPSDVYSFGLIMWELFKRWQVDFGSIPGIYKAVVVNHESTFAEMLKTQPADWFPFPDVICEFLPKCWAKDPTSCVSAHHAFFYLDGITHQFEDHTPLIAPFPYNQYVKPVTSYILAVEKKSEVSGVFIDPVEPSVRKWEREKIVDWFD